MAPMIKCRKPASANKNRPPVLGREFLMQNHADIVSSVAIVIVFGQMFQFTKPVSSLFITLQYGQATATGRNFQQTYSTGLKDLFTVFFHFLVCIVFNHIFQGCILRKIFHKLCLPKSKYSKFIESGQQIMFNGISMVWGLDIIVKENWLADLSLLAGYPNSALSFYTKFFYIIQFSYWAHILPNLYFQEVKKKEMLSRVKYSIFYLAFIASVYITNFHHVGVIVLLLHYITGITKHVVKLIALTEKDEDSKIVRLAQNVYNWLFFTVQSLILILSQKMLWFSLNGVVYTGKLRDFNTPMCKLLFSISALVTQAWMVFCEFSTSGKSLNISALLRFIKFKPAAAKADNANKKRKNSANRKFDVQTEADQNNKIVQKSEDKKKAKI